MKEIICTSQAELDAVDADFDGKIIIDFGTPKNRAIVRRRFKFSVEAYGNSSVVAYGNSSVVAYDNSSVVAWNNSSVEAYGNSQVVDAERRGNIKTNGNARVVYNPQTIDEYIDFYGLDSIATTVKLYKAVHKSNNGVYHADYDPSFLYSIGDTFEPRNGFNDDVNNNCGAGIHLAHKAWATNYGIAWHDLAILECECNKDDVLVPLNGEGKVRARKIKVLREAPLEECGLQGKIIAKGRKQ